MRSITMRIERLIVATLALTVAPAALAQAPAAPLPDPTPGQTVIVGLASGDAVKAVLVSETADSIVLQHPVLGKITVARASVSSMTVAPPAKAAAAAPAAADTDDDTRLRQEAQPAANADMDAPRAQDGVNPADDAAKAPPVAPPPVPSPWKLLFDANVNYVNAANKQLDFRVAASAIYEVKDVEKWANNVEYFFKVVDGGTTDNNLLGTSTYDHRFDWNTRVLWFVKGQGQMAPLESYEQRLSAWGGLGYELLKLPPAKLLGKMGVGYTYEFGDQQDGQAELYAEIEWDWKISENQAIVGSFWIAPSFEDFTDYLFLFRTEWTMSVADVKGLKMLGGVRWQYQSTVIPADAIQNDIRLYAGLRYEI
jgi:putative salt-induced outer membrane protein YdiY